MLFLIGCTPMTPGPDGGSTSGGAAGTGGGVSGTGGGASGGGTTAGGTAGSTAGGSAGANGGGTGGATAGGSAGGSVSPVAQPITALSAGDGFTCAVLADKTVKCWGRNNAGQLGNGSMMDSFRPVQVTGITTAVSVSAGYEHACAVLEDRSAKCWGVEGSSNAGQLGNGGTTGSRTPVTVMGTTQWASVHAGAFITCGVTMARTVFCWGANGQLGNGVGAASSVPVQVNGLADVVQLSVASNAGTSGANHVCGVRMNGTAFCWGNNNDGQVGMGNQNSARTPMEVLNVSDAIEVTAGGYHACARRMSGVSCWGTAPEIGDGTVVRKFVATPVATNPNVTELEAGDRATLGRTPGNGLICWGFSGTGVCADGMPFPPSGPRFESPMTTLLMNVSLFDVGASHACAYVPSTQVTWCWGSSNYGEAGFELPLAMRRTSTPDFVRW